MGNELSVVSEPLWIEDYEGHRHPQLVSLVRRSVEGIWDADRDLPWSTDVDAERLGAEEMVVRGRPDLDVSGTGAEAWGDADWAAFALERQTWQLSQFLHGEQAAMLCAARIVETCPWMDGRAVAATQVADEARHVTAFSRYVDTKLTGRFDISPELKSLFADIIMDSRWDIIYLGMQVLVEGVALTAFGRLLRRTKEPLLAALLTRVLSDESRHVAFGMVSLDEVYQSLSAQELHARQEFALDAILRLAGQSFKSDLWERAGLSQADALELVKRSKYGASFQREVVSRVIPSCRHLGLLDANDGWLAEQLATAGIPVPPPKAERSAGVTPAPA